MRDECLSLTPEEFLTSPDYKNLQIWDLKYLSTSDEEDEDLSSTEDEEEDEDSSEDEDEDSEEKAKRLKKK